MNQAEQIAERFGNDGQCFIARGESLADSVNMDEVCSESARLIHRGRIEYDDNVESAVFDPEGDLTRYEFADGSAIVVSMFAWDIEGSEYFSWKGNE